MWGGAVFPVLCGSKVNCPAPLNASFVRIKDGLLALAGWGGAVLENVLNTGGSGVDPRGRLRVVGGTTLAARTEAGRRVGRPGALLGQWRPGFAPVNFLVNPGPLFFTCGWKRERAGMNERASAFLPLRWSSHSIFGQLQLPEAPEETGFLCGGLMHPSALPVWLLLRRAHQGRTPNVWRVSLDVRASQLPRCLCCCPPTHTHTAAPPLISRADGHLLFLGHVSTRSSSVVDGEETTRDK